MGGSGCSAFNPASAYWRPASGFTPAQCGLPTRLLNDLRKADLYVLRRRMGMLLNSALFHRYVGCSTTWRSPMREHTNLDESLTATWVADEARRPGKTCAEPTS